MRCNRCGKLIKPEDIGKYAPGIVWKTMNGGTSWNEISGDLPSIPLKCIAISRDPSLQNPLIFVGGDPGVFVSNEILGGVTGQVVHWTKYGIGLPEVKIMDMEIRQGTLPQYITVGTLGRGVYTADISGLEIPSLNAPA